MNKNLQKKNKVIVVVFLVLLVSIVWILIGTSNLNYSVQNMTATSEQKDSCEGEIEIFFLNFNSHMKREDFQKEMTTNKNLVNGLNPIVFGGQKLEFSINPYFNKNGCLSSVELYAELQFGDTRSFDILEMAFCDSLVELFESKYGFLHFSDSVATGLHMTGENPVQEAIDALAGIKSNIPYWVNVYAYKGCRNDLDKNGKLFIIDSYTYLKREANDYELDLEKSKDIDVVTSARYKNYFTRDSLVQIKIITSFYDHQVGYGEPKIKSSRSRVKMVYYSKRYLIEEIERKSIEIEKKRKLQEKRDSIVNTNKLRI
jgi:hypothetical protein